MALTFEEEKIFLKDVVSIEEAEELYERLLKVDEVVINLSECEHMHTAILQLLLLFRGKVRFEEIEKFKFSL